MLCTCTFNYRPCSIDDFIMFKSASYGLCFTFNAKMKNMTGDSSIRHSNLYGGPGILKLGLYIHSYQYIPYITDGKNNLLFFFRYLNRLHVFVISYWCISSCS